MLRQAVKKHKENTGDENAKLVVLRFRDSDVWWVSNHTVSVWLVSFAGILSDEQSLISFALQYKLLDSDQKGLVKKITVDKKNADRGIKAAQQRVEDYERKE